MKDAYSFKEFREVPIDNGFHDLAVDVGKPDTEVGSHNQKAGKHYEINELLCFVRGDRYLQEFFDSRQEHLIYITFTSL